MSASTQNDSASVCGIVQAAFGPDLVAARIDCSSLGLEPKEIPPAEAVISAGEPATATHTFEWKLIRLTTTAPVTEESLLAITSVLRSFHYHGAFLSSKEGCALFNGAVSVVVWVGAPEQQLLYGWLLGHKIVCGLSRINDATILILPSGIEETTVLNAICKSLRQLKQWQESVRHSLLTGARTVPDWALGWDGKNF